MIVFQKEIGSKLAPIWGSLVVQTFKMDVPTNPDIPGSEPGEVERGLMLFHSRPSGYQEIYVLDQGEVLPLIEKASQLDEAELFNAIDGWDEKLKAI